MIIISFLIIVHTISCCTTFGIGRKATIDNSVISTHSNDGGGTTDPRLIKVLAQDYKDDDLRPIFYSPESYPRYVGYHRNISEYYPENCQAGKEQCIVMEPIGYIPQVKHTFAYFEETYGVMNDKQVSISESTCSGVFVGLSIAEGGKALLSIDQLSQIAMERASTSREAVELMGSLAEQYGFYGEDDSFEGGSESLFVGDPQELWVFHILADPSGTSAIWGAARVPDDSVAVVANMFSIRVMNLSDTENFLGRKDMWEIAEREGLYIPGNPKDFTATFSDGEYAHKYYSGRRMWRVFDLLAPSMNLSADYNNLKIDAPYPFSVPLDKKVSVQDVMSIMREWYNGTRFTTGEGSGVAGGAFASPDRYSNAGYDNTVSGNWERTIAIYRSSDTYIVQSRADYPDTFGGVIWFGSGAAHTTVYVPILTGLALSPSSLSSGWQGIYNETTVYWTNRKILNIAQMKFNYMIKDIRTIQNELESSSYELIQVISNDFKHQFTNAQHVFGNSIEWNLIQDILLRNIDKCIKTYQKLFNYLLFTYADGSLNYWYDDRFHSIALGYPVWWLEAGNYKNGPPPVDISTLIHGNLIQQYKIKMQKIIASGERLFDKNQKEILTMAILNENSISDVNNHLYQTVHNKLEIFDRISIDSLLSKEKYVIDCIKIECSVKELIDIYKSCVHNCLSAL